MTLKELLETNHRIGELSLHIRDKKRKLIDEIHLGSHVTEDIVKSPTMEPRWKCIKNPLNIKESGDYWGTNFKSIPKELLCLQVQFWDWHGDAFRLNNGLLEFGLLYVDVEGADSFIESTATEEELQLPGQMRIEDFLDRGE